MYICVRITPTQTYPILKILCLRVEVFSGKKILINYLEEKFKMWKNKSIVLSTYSKKRNHPKT